MFCAYILKQSRFRKNGGSIGAGHEPESVIALSL